LERNKETNRIRFGRIGYLLLAFLFTSCIVIQVFLAGLSIFINPGNWAKHTTFVHLFDKIPILMFVMTFLGQMPRWASWQSAGLFGLVYVMYFTANITGILPSVAAVHPVIAMVMFWISIMTYVRQDMGPKGRGSHSYVLEPLHRCYPKQIKIAITSS
jgi:hypothetical protein